MSNPTNTVDLTQTLAQFLTAHSALLQQKIDKPGGKVPPEGTIRNAGAVWGDFFDDFILSFMSGQGRVQRTVGVTTDATPLNLGPLISPVPDGGQVHIELFGWGRAAANDFVFLEKRVRVENSGGALQDYIDVMGTPQYSTAGTLSTATYAVSPSTNPPAYEVVVTGEAATNISWEIYWRIIGAFR